MLDLLVNFSLFTLSTLCIFIFFSIIVVLVKVFQFGSVSYLKFSFFL